MAAKTVAANKAALTRAREAREKLDADRRAQEQRQDEATATALVELGELEQIHAVRTAKVADVGHAIRGLLAEDVSAERAAGLLGLDAAELRRLSKVAPPEVATSGSGGTASGKQVAAGVKATVTPLPDQDASQGGSEGAARQAG